MTRVRDPAMTRIVELLLEEHRNIKKLLHVLEQELNVFDHSDQPDYEILRAIIEYFQDYPEGYHHPKEDMVFEKLKLRDPAVAKRIGDVQEEHQVETKRLQRFAHAVDDVLAGREYLRQEFHDVVHDFIQHQREHMDKEEMMLFPAAVNALQPEDWAEIDTRLNDRKDPLFDDASQKNYDSLQQTILRWGRETQEIRMAPVRTQPQ
jgi:hemerythrin-like domain-containing protein